MLRQATRKLICMLVPGLLISAVLLAVACRGLVTSLAPEPATTSTIGRSQVDVALRSQDARNGGPSASSGQAPLGGLGLVPLESVGFERISVEQGLSQSSIDCILQDSRGFMWFGTNDGLNRYDGYSFTVYRHSPENPHSLSNNIVRSIHEDRWGLLWVGTWGGGLDRFDRDTGQFAHYQNDPSDPNSLSSDFVLAVHRDQEGVLWVGTDGAGLDRFDQDEEGFTHYQNDPRDPNSLSGNTVFSIYRDREGQLWIGTDGGLDRFDPDLERFVHYRHMAGDPRGLSHSAVLTIYQDREAALWVGTADGLNKLDRDTERFTHYYSDPDDSGSLSDDYILSIHEDLAGVLWIGTGGGGLNRYDRETESFTRYQNDPSDPNSLSNNIVLSVYGDRSGALWVGTAGGGGNKLDRTAGRFAHFQSEPQDPTSLSSNMVWSIFQDRNGVLWIGTYGGGLNKYDRASGTFMRYPHNLDDFQSWSDYTVSALYEDQDGRLWVGTQEGLYTFYREAETFRRWMSQHVVTSILEDGAGVLWVGALGGLTRLGQSRATAKTYLHDVDDLHSLSSSEVRVVYEDRAGVLWIGTDEGLNRFDRDTERFTRYQKDTHDSSSLSDNFVLSIHEDRSGNLWIGTYGGGLNRFDRGSETFTRYRERDGLPSDVIYGILEDSQGNLWLSTNVGLSKFDPRIETFRNYDVRDGLQSNEFNGGAYYRSSSGEMFFGGINGFNAFYPERVVDNPYVPPIVLTSLTQSGEDVEVGQALEKAKEVTFHWPNNFFEFEFAALSYCQSDRNQYAYMLEGFDENWNYIGTRRFGRYTNLPGGTYTLRMKGSNNDNVWNEEGISAKVTIVQPFWATWWFRALIAVALVGSVVGGYRLRVKSVEVRARELEKQVDERTHALAQRTREIERRRQELEALYLADERMHRHLHLDQVLQALVDVAVDILQADKSAVLVWNERRDRLEVRVVRGFDPESMAHLSFARGEGVTGYVADSGEPVLLEDTLADPRRAGERAEIVDVVLAEGIRSFMHLPITIDDEVFAVFNVSFTEPHAFGGDELRLFQALAQRAAVAIENAQLYEQTQQLAVVEERNRLARELHDAVTQTLFSTSLIAEALPSLWESDQQEGRELLKELRQLSRGALAEMRTLLLELRPAALVEASLSDLLRQLGEAVTGRKGVPVAVTVEGEGVIPDEVHVALYRIAQEALNNVVKHAHANQVAVDLHCSTWGSGEIVELCISDDGRGFDPSSVPPDRLGLSIIRERAQAVGATLEIDSEPDVGTKIVVVWREDKQPVIREDD